MDEESSPNGYSNATAEARPAPSAPSGRFQCPECTQTFGRVEHLTRHSRSHTNERFLKCVFCRKGFYRIDALRRHEQVHNQPKRSALGKRARACLACAAARRKCSGGEPCAPCDKRTIECRYPDATRTRKTTASEAPGLDPTVNENISVQSVEEPIMLHGQDSPMSWSNRSESPRMNSGHPQKLAPGANSRISNASHHSHSYDPDIYVSPFSQQRMPVQTPISPGLQQELDQQTGQPSLHPDRHTTIGSSHLSPPIQDPLSGINTQTLESNLNLNDDQIPEAWFQNNFSLNWLPENQSPGYQIDALNGLSSFDHDHAMIFEHPLQRNPSSYAANSENLFLAAPVSPRIPRTSEQARMTPLQHLVDSHEISISSPSSQSTHSGQFYVDGDGARFPRVRKLPYRHPDARASAFLHENRDVNPDFVFPDLNEYPDEPNVPLSNISNIPAAVYGEILRMYNLTCTNSSHYSNFQGGPFPSLQMFNRLVQLYGSHFRAILPFIHPASFDVSSTHWLLTLALATVGSHYVEDGSGQLVVAMSEFLRRVVQTVVDNGTANRPDSLTLTQVKILCCVGMMYCGDKRLMTIAKSYHSDLTSFCDTEWARLSVETQSSPASNDSEHFNLDWAIWIRAESGRRTGYCIWLLDSMWAFHFQIRPLLSLQDAKILIPCQEVLWEAESELDWGQLYACATPSPSLHAAIQLAYIEKRLQSSMGEFSRILCIHALIRRTWEVETYFSNPLALWTPTAEKGSITALSSSTTSSGSVWLPSIQTYAKWRNSACDCLDILHWHANSIIGAASGMEHPTVLHLHLARVILLTPFRQIVQLAEIMTSQTTPADSEAETRIRAHIARWVLEDQHKARLALIHAGVLFWHVRRYSADAFYEPSSVYISTLALWAYGTFAPHTTSPPPDANPSADAASDTESLFPTSMQLDRPADDELVQLFVKRGASMKANITGVGNLCSAKGPVRVLTEGRNLLVGLKSWGISGMAIRTLSGLIDVCKTAQVRGVVGEGGN